MIVATTCSAELGGVGTAQTFCGLSASRATTSRPSLSPSSAERNDGRIMRITPAVPGGATSAKRAVREADCCCTALARGHGHTRSEADCMSSHSGGAIPSSSAHSKAG
jgi:hypothetical protein